MTTYQEILTQVVQLPTHERLKLIEVLTRSLYQEVPLQQNDAATIEQKLAALRRLSGIAKSEDLALDDQEAIDDYVNYLTRKYA